MAEKKYLMGNEVLGHAARAAKAEAMYGYPITPASEILHFWAKEQCSPAGQKDGLVFQQAEDEIAAGFMLIGGVLAGRRSFTATAGPGNILMQDAFSMAEAMRIPTVAYIMQRGGPSTSTVIYSQQEVNLTCFGGNGNGFRIVYSPANLQELYDYGIKVFNTAWKWRFPTFLLGDGYLAKMMGEVELYDPAERGIESVPTEAYMLESKRVVDLRQVIPSPELDVRSVAGVEYACLRNCLNMEEETLAVNEEIKHAWDQMAMEVTEHQFVGDPNAKTILIAHGIVATAAGKAVQKTADLSTALFRPITLNPFPAQALRTAVANAERIIVIESAYNQLGRLVKDALYGHAQVPLIEHYRPSMSILVEDIVDLIKEHVTA
ncbi:MAG: ferredoxin oxidoreductase [Patescibacteria group bacterium]